MRTHGRMLGMLLAMVMAHAAAAQTLEWGELAKLARGTAIWVTAAGKTEACLFERTANETLYCQTIPGEMEASDARPQMLSFRRADIRSIQIVPRREYGKLVNTRGWLDFVTEFGGGAGLDARNQPNGFGVFKIGRAITLNMQVDCVSGHCGFGVENAGVIPVGRYPGFVPGKQQSFARLYVEPGVGYRFGQGPFGAYTSAGALIMFWKGTTTSPYLEYTHRFPFGSPWRGDNRIAFGWMIAFPQ